MGLVRNGLFRMVACAVVAVASLAVSDASADSVYLRSSAGQPWGVATNEAAMNTAFGTGNWQDLRYETTTAASLFSTTNRFIFMEGGDFTANEMEAFLNGQPVRDGGMGCGGRQPVP